MLDKSLFQCDITGLIAVSIVVEEAVEADASRRSNERTERCLRLKSATCADSYDGKSAVFRLVGPCFEVYVGEGIELIDYDIYVITANTRGLNRYSLAFVGSCYCAEFSVSGLVLDFIEVISYS